MAITIGNQTNIDKSNLVAYPNGQIKDDSGIGDGTPINCVTASDIWEFFDKIMRLSGTSFNGNFDNETNGYQYVQAAVALASKSDYVLPLTSVSGVLQVPTKLGILQDNEKLLLLASADYVAETDIAGSDSPVVTKTIIITKQWKAGDYLLMVNTTSGVKIIQLISGDNLNYNIGANGFLQAADNATTIAGTSAAVAVTPASLLFAIAKYLNDATLSTPYLATTTLNGLMSTADKVKLDAVVNKVINRGYFSVVDINGGSVGSAYTVGGQCTSATITAQYGGGYYPTIGGRLVGAGTVIRVVMPTAMSSLDYKIDLVVESLGDLQYDSIFWQPIFKKVNTTTFDIVIREGVNEAETLKIHFDAIQIA